EPQDPGTESLRRFEWRSAFPAPVSSAFPEAYAQDDGREDPCRVEIDPEAHVQPYRSLIEQEDLVLDGDPCDDPGVRTVGVLLEAIAADLAGHTTDTEDVVKEIRQFIGDPADRDAGTDHLLPSRGQHVPESDQIRAYA